MPRVVGYRISSQATMHRSYYGDAFVSLSGVGDDMNVREPAVVEDFFRSTTWTDHYAAYSRWREQSPVLARMPFVLPDGSQIETFN